MRTVLLALSIKTKEWINVLKEDILFRKSINTNDDFLNVHLRNNSNSNNQTNFNYSNLNQRQYHQLIYT